MELKDHGNRYFEYKNLRIHACDVDEDGNIENVDIVVDGRLKFCINIQNPGLGSNVQDYADALAVIFDAMTAK